MTFVAVQPRLERLDDYVNLAIANDYVFELIEPAYPEFLDDLPAYFRRYRALAPDGLAKVLHGPYIDIAVHTADTAIRAASQLRVRESVEWARQIGAHGLILHSNHLPMINEQRYDDEWIGRTAEFFTDLDLDGITLLVENMWDPNPDLMVRLVEATQSERIRLCFDVAHWNVFGQVSIAEWLALAGGYTTYIQYGDNHGDRDADLTLGSGTIDWADLDQAIRRYTPSAAVMVGVGIDDGRRLGDSLTFLRARNIHPFGAARDRWANQ